MKMKIITALITFAATFGTSSALTGLFVGKQTPQPCYAVKSNSDNQTRLKILTLLRQDISNGENRFDKISCIRPAYSATWLAVYSKAVVKYSNESGSMDDGGLPRDFQLAWRQHMKAWRDHAIYVNQISQDKNASTDEIFGAFADQDDAINRTWDLVLAIADSYDANPYHQ